MNETIKPEPISVKILPAEINVSNEITSFIITAASVIALVLIQRKLHNPDTMIQLRMRTSLAIYRFADEQAQFWHKVSARATDAYLASRP